MWTSAPVRATTVSRPVSTLPVATCVLARKGSLYTQTTGPAGESLRYQKKNKTP
uniref:Uncharacterized protein n=1 Tax=Timema poppense TaxID=170557 RepID=A0A7R9DW22_TIMPO|nr:unnamed protein product [Timema poppensis]